MYKTPSAPSELFNKNTGPHFTWIELLLKSQSHADEDVIKQSRQREKKSLKVIQGCENKIV